jgi:hypothetical protein
MLVETAPARRALQPRDDHVAPLSHAQGETTGFLAFADGLRQAGPMDADDWTQVDVVEGLVKEIHDAFLDRVGEPEYPPWPSDVYVFLVGAAGFEPATSAL